ncbi:MAG: FtsX-like permease family protein [Pedosphaera sp.]|nr:FtsX-like permease family protein [Pedosphaera sp.]
MISSFQLILREMRHSRLNTCLSLVAIIATVALLVGVHLLTAAAEREARRVSRDLGFNLRIVPRNTDPDRFFLEGYSDQTLPEDAVRQLASAAGTFVTFNHLTPALERRIRLQERDCLLTGLGQSVTGPGEKKQPMGFHIPLGKAHVGFLLAHHFNLKNGSSLRVLNRDLVVEKVLLEAGTDEDLRLYTSLADAQTILGLSGRISEIKAIDCLCLTADQDPLTQIRAALEKVLPEARVLQMRTLADARAKQRQSSENVTAFAVPMTLLAAALWVGTLFILNVRQRRSEIGLWRALGSGSGSIATLFLGKAALLGLIGGTVGYFVGTTIALQFGPHLFPVTAASLQANFQLFPKALLLTSAFAVLAAFLPAMIAVAQDPAGTLRAD